MVKYSEYAEELEGLLEQDQLKWRSFWRENYKLQDSDAFKTGFEAVRQEQHAHTKRMLTILDEIEEPTLSNVGERAAQAISIIALHDSLPVLARVLDVFEQCYNKDKPDTYYQAIPSMTDKVLISERKPQRFGTQWEGDGLSEPFLPTVEDFEHINERRAEYGIEPLRWPKSLAIPEDEQPWLKRPVSELTTRDLTDEEFERSYRTYLT